MKDEVCETFWSYFFGRPERINICKAHYGVEKARNPFRWPDPDMKTWPTPK